VVIRLTVVQKRSIDIGLSDERESRVSLVGSIYPSVLAFLRLTLRLSVSHLILWLMVQGLSHVVLYKPLYKQASGAA